MTYAVLVLELSVEATTVVGASEVTSTMAALTIAASATTGWNMISLEDDLYSKWARQHLKKSTKYTAISHILTNLNARFGEGPRKIILSKVGLTLNPPW